MNEPPIIMTSLQVAAIAAAIALNLVILIGK